jgi:hypothetical protein
MRKLTLPALAALVLAGALTAAELKLPPEVKGDPGDFVTVPADTSGKDVKWVALDAGLKVFPSSLLKDSKTAVVTAQKPGKYRLLAYTADEKGPSEPAITTVVIAGVDPTPPAPPPGPPTPPTPPPEPAPIPLAGLRVLIVYESKDLATMPEPQKGILYGKSSPDYLSSKCVVGADGKTREWRIWDADVDASGGGKHWQDALKRKRDRLPWVIISNPGKGGFEGPLPENAEKFLELVKKYEGGA